MKPTIKEFICEWCGAEQDCELDLDEGKCLYCVVNECNHSNNDMCSFNVDRKLVVFDYVCMDCEVCWTETHILDRGTKSKLHHENLNANDIWENEVKE